MIGTTVDQYRIVARIGGGGMGEVYRAIDLELQRDVAIKCVRPELSDLEEVTKRFRNEARTLAKLSHPNIATVYRFFADNERLFLVMEYIQGTPFGDRLRQQGVPPWQESVSMIRNALHGLGYAHEQGIVHRDIKPGNLMVDQRGTVKVLDFGIAHLIGGTRLTRAGSVVGTPAYMAPEQILGKSVDPRTDLYSLGIVLYELLSGQLPYQGDSEFELMRSHLEKHPPPLRDLTGSKVPIALQNTVETALGKEKGDRFQTAAEFDEALGEALEDRTSVRVSKTTVLTPEALGQVKPAADGPADPPSQNMSELIRPVATEIRRRMRPSQIGVGAGVALAVVVAGWLVIGPGSPDTPTQPGTTLPPMSGQPGTQPQNAYMPGTAMMPGTADGTTLPDGTRLTSPAGDPTSMPMQLSGGGGMPPAGGGMPSSGSDAMNPGSGNPGAGAPGSGGMSSGVGASGMAGGAVAPGAVAGTGAMGNMPANGLVGSGASPAPQSSRPAPQPRVEPRREPAPAQRPAETRPAVASGGLAITPIKVGYHERQGTGRWSRDAGYNGAFNLRFPPGRGQGLPVEEIVVVRQEGRVVKTIPVITETRLPGQFKSKNRIPGLRELSIGLYDLELQFHAEGRVIGSYKWRLEVVN